MYSLYIHCMQCLNIILTYSRFMQQLVKTGKGVLIGENCKFGKDIVIWNYVVLGNDVKIGDGTKIGSFVDIGKDVKIGKNCIIQAHVTISNGCILGDNVFIAPNSSLLNDKYPKSSFMTPNSFSHANFTARPKVSFHSLPLCLGVL